MLCVSCDNQARASCRFCGSGVCRDHARAQRFVSGWSAFGQSGWGSIPRTQYDFVVVENAVWCGRCTVHASRGSG